MRRPAAWKIGLLAVAATLLTPSAVDAATPPTESPVHAKERRTRTLTGLSQDQQEAAVKLARAQATGPKFAVPSAKPQGGATDRELDLICNDDWFVTFDEDADGDPILGTFELHCAGTVIPLP